MRRSGSVSVANCANRIKCAAGASVLRGSGDGVEPPAPGPPGACVAGRSVAGGLQTWLKLAGVVMVCAVGPDLKAQGAMTLTNWTYQETFDSLTWNKPDSLVPVGWSFAESGPNANSTYGADEGLNPLGDTYSYGYQGQIHFDRAFGMLRDGNLSSTIGVQFVNNLGYTITAIEVSYIGEQWRLGTRTGTTADRLQFAYKIGGGTLTDGTWTYVDGLDFLSPQTSGLAGALDGNDPANQTDISYYLSYLNIGEGETFWLRWSDFANPDGDDGLAIDNFSITVIPEPPPGALMAIGGGLLLAWMVRRRCSVG